MRPHDIVLPLLRDSGSEARASCSRGIQGIGWNRTEESGLKALHRVAAFVTVLNAMPRDSTLSRRTMKQPFTETLLLIVSRCSE